MKQVVAVVWCDKPIKPSLKMCEPPTLYPSDV